MAKEKHSGDDSLLRAGESVATHATENQIPLRAVEPKKKRLVLTFTDDKKKDRPLSKDSEMTAIS
jgi:hypothetical protein